MLLAGAASGGAEAVAYRPDALRAATRITRGGPRPAGSRAELRAHAFVARGFRRAGLRVDVQRFGVPGHGRSRNVIGKLDTARSCLRIVMAHTDTTSFGPGANDNASGVGALVELAPRLASLEPGCDVWLVATGAEERIYTGSPDHLGALALARRVRARRLRLRWALSLDEVGRDRPFWLRSPVGGERSGVEGELLRAARKARVAHPAGRGRRRRAVQAYGLRPRGAPGPALTGSGAAGGGAGAQRAPVTTQRTLPLSFSWVTLTVRVFFPEAVALHANVSPRLISTSSGQLTLTFFPSSAVNRFAIVRSASAMSSFCVPQPAQARTAPSEQAAASVRFKR